MKVGDHVEDFELPDETGTKRSLKELLANGPVVLFFYPAAMTYGCTKESCHFRDLKAEFEEVGAQRVGISADSVDKQHQFSEKHDFDYPLLSDPDKTVATMFGVKRGFGPQQAHDVRDRHRSDRPGRDRQRDQHGQARRQGPRRPPRPPAVGDQTNTGLEGGQSG